MTDSPNNDETDNGFFNVSVTLNGDEATARSLAFDDGAVTDVTILVYNSLGERVGSGALAKGSTSWAGTIDVSETGTAQFEANALDGSGNILYVGRIPYTVDGVGDAITIPVGAASLRSGSIQGYSPTLTTMVNTFAGSSAPGTGMISPLIGTAALFTNPYGMISDGTNVYVVDWGSNNIRKIVLATQAVSTYAGQINGAGGRTEALDIGAAFNTPRGIATDGTNFYIADYGNNTIRKIVIATATVSAFAGTLGQVAGFTDGLASAATFTSPSGITFYNGFLYVADTVNNRIRKIDVSDGNVTTLAGLPNVEGPTNEGAIDGPAVDAKFNLPQGITTLGAYVYVADTNNHKIRRILIADGYTDTIAGIGTAGVINGAGNVASFNLPTGITSDGTYLYVTEFGSHTIRKITVGTSSALSTVALLAGTASTSGTVSGIGSAAQFAGPVGITTDGTNLYVSDYDGHTIRKIQ